MAERLDLGDLIYRLGFDDEAEFLKALDKVFVDAEKRTKAAGKKAGEGFGDGIADGFEASAKQLSQQLSLLEARYSSGRVNAAEYQAGLKQLETGFESLGRQAKTLDQQLDIEQGLARVKNQARGFKNDFLDSLGMQTIGSFLGNTLANAFGAALQSTQQFVSNSNAEFKTYSLSLNQAVVGGVKDLEGFKAQIKSLSDQTKAFSETEISVGVGKLVQQGYTAENAFKLIAQGADIAKSSIDPVTGEFEDLSTISVQLSNVLEALGIPLEDTGKTADVLAKAAQDSGLNVADLVNIVAEVGPTAATAGIKLEDLAAAAGVLSTKGLDASTIGSGLRSVLNTLLSPSDKVRGSFDALGITLVDNQGKSRNFMDILQQLNNVTSAGGRGAQFLAQGFDSFGLSVVTNLGRSSSEIKTFSSNLGSAEGSAKNLASELNRGQEARQNAERELANLRKEVGEQLAPSLVILYRDVLPPVVQGFGWVIEKVGALIKVIERLIGVQDNAKTSAEKWTTSYGVQLDKQQSAQAQALLTEKQIIEGRLQILNRPQTGLAGVLYAPLSSQEKAEKLALEQRLKEIPLQLIAIQKQAEQTKTALDRATGSNSGAGGYRQTLDALGGNRNPVRISQQVGANKNTDLDGDGIPEYGKDGHNGLDIVVGGDGRVFNPFAGAQVLRRGFDAIYGNFIELALDKNTKVLLGHFANVGVEVGKVLEKGAVLGIQGSTGKSTGPHVHIGFRVNGKTVYSQSELEQLMAKFGAEGANAFDASLLNRPTKDRTKNDPVVEQAEALGNKLKILDNRFAIGQINAQGYRAEMGKLEAQLNKLLAGAREDDQKLALTDVLADIRSNRAELDKDAAEAQKRAKERADKAAADRAARDREQIAANDRMAEAIRAQQTAQANRENAQREQRQEDLEKARAEEIAANDRVAQLLREQQTAQANRENAQREQQQDKNQQDVEARIESAKNEFEVARIIAQQKEEFRAAAYRQQQQDNENNAAYDQNRIQAQEKINALLAEAATQLDPVDLGDGLDGFSDRYTNIEGQLKAGKITADFFEKAVAELVDELNNFAKLAADEGDFKLFGAATVAAEGLLEKTQQLLKNYKSTDKVPKLEVPIVPVLEAGTVAPVQEAQQELVAETNHQLFPSVNAVEDLNGEYQTLELRLKSGKITASEFAQGVGGLVGTLQGFVKIAGEKEDFVLFDSANSTMDALLDKAERLLGFSLRISGALGGVPTNDTGRNPTPVSEGGTLVPVQPGGLIPVADDGQNPFPRLPTVPVIGAADPAITFTDPQALERFDLELQGVLKSGVKGFFSELTDGTPDLAAAFKKLFDDVGGFFVDKLIDGIVGPIAQEFGAMITKQLAASSASNSLGGAAGGLGALGPAGLALGFGLLVSTLISDLLNKPADPAAVEASRSGGRDRSVGEINTKIETAISVTLPGGLNDAATRANMAAIAEDVSLGVLRRSGLLELVEKLRKGEV
jgi:TP901 family phage tail tape measure protein